MSVLVDPASDRDDVYYAICSEVDNEFIHRQTGHRFTQLALGCHINLHPDAIVKELARQIVDNYDIVEDITIC